VISASASQLMSSWNVWDVGTSVNLWEA
jgi:hypothetical protein